MLDFMRVAATINKKSGVTKVGPKFLIGKHKDLMVKGGDFYAIWDSHLGLWSTDENDAVRLMDEQIWNYYNEHRKEWGDEVEVLTAESAESGVIDRFHKYCQRQLRDCFHQLDDTIIFSDTETKQSNYSSHRLVYPLIEASTPAWDEIMSTLYSAEERRKIEWAIGAIVTGDSKKLQKFLVLYGPGGTGKSTVLDIIEAMFQGYTSSFDAEALGQGNNSFALEPFSTNPLVAIDHEAKLNRLETNTKINAIVSHDEMPVNEKFKKIYKMRFRSFLILATNSPVRITDKKSGLLRRLIDVRPTGKLIPTDRYFELMDKVMLELGGIASHCKNVYLSDPKYYNSYIPIRMMEETNDFFNFIMDSYDIFNTNNETSLKAAWELYKIYCDEAKVPYPYSKRAFKEELKNYFDIFEDRGKTADGVTVRSLYSGFKPPIDEDGKTIPMKTVSSSVKQSEPQNGIEYGWIKLDGHGEIFDAACADCPAQLANRYDVPAVKWVDNTKQLKDILTSKLHFVKVPLNHIVLDFDICDPETGEKSLELNLQEAMKWPQTYCELSKSGKGVHLHYIYQGDPLVLAPKVGDKVEVKVFNGGSSLRRMVTLSNMLPIAILGAGLLPTVSKKKGGPDGVVNKWQFRDAKDLRNKIGRILNKEFHDNTTQSMHFIKKVLEDAYESGIEYDFTGPGDIGDAIYEFALNSTNQADHCLDIYDELYLKSKQDIDIGSGITGEENDDPIVFFDCEVYKNFFCIVLKPEGEGKKFIKLINPSPAEVENLLSFKLVGFNCRDYDNHILYGRIMGYDNMHLYELSQAIITQGYRGFREATNISYTDIYDFCSKKQSLKKWEIELGIDHQEMSIPWDQPVPEDMFDKVVDYCCNDVAATEAVWNKRQGDFKAREMLVTMVRTIQGLDCCVNDTNNNLSAKLIFGNDWEPQKQFQYRFLGDPIKDGWTCDDWLDAWHKSKDGHVNMKGKPWFPGYSYDGKTSTYRGENVKEGGRVYADWHQIKDENGELKFKKNGKPEIQIGGIYYHIKTQDVSGMHPASLRAENYFGPKYTKIFGDIVDTRTYIKHDDLDKARSLFNGVLAPFLENESDAGMINKAFKIVVNSVYGKTAQRPKQGQKNYNRFWDDRNIDNIVAKRGALFMTDLKYALEKIFPDHRIVHIKTDSIKVEYTTDKIIEFIREFGKAYGYEFETEAYYEKLCLVNNAVYIAKLADDPINGDEAGKWTATGTQFQIPYIFKTLFSKEPLDFKDYCVTQNVTKGALYLDFNEGYPDVSALEKQLQDINTIRNACYVLMGGSDRFNISDDENIMKKVRLYNRHYNTHYCESEFGGPGIVDLIQDDRNALMNDILEGHNYQFIGKVGQFTPVLEGHNGGWLVCKDGDKYSSPSGAKGFKWMESSVVKNLNLMDIIDMDYFNQLAIEAKEAIEARGDFYEFAEGTGFSEFMTIPLSDSEEIPYE